MNSKSLTDFSKVELDCRSGSEVVRSATVVGDTASDASLDGPRGTGDRETSIRRSLEVLLSLGSDEAIEQGTLGVTKIAELLGREKSQVSRTLKTLAEYGLVDRNPETRGYRLGWRIYALATLAGERLLLDAGRPVLQQLVNEFGERAFLSVLHGAETITILSESAPTRVQSMGWVGRTAPIYCTAVGRALLVDEPDGAILQLLASRSMDQVGPNTATTPKAYMERIAEARERGFSVADEELEAGLVAVATPVRNPEGRIIAAINISGPKYRFDSSIDQAGVRLIDAARNLSAALKGMSSGD
jgi:IclR family KDG regulon transcriptional repressor